MGAKTKLPAVPYPCDPLIGVLVGARYGTYFEVSSLSFDNFINTLGCFMAFRLN